MTLPASLNLGLNRVGRLSAPSGVAPVLWLFPDMPADVEIIVKNESELIFTCPAACSFSVGAQTAEVGKQPTWCKVTFAKPTLLPDLSRIRKFLPSLSSTAKASGFAGLGALLMALSTLAIPGCPTPTPGPVPPPVPPKPPGPVVQKGDFVVAITDSEHPSVQLAAILMDESLAGWLHDQAVKFRVVDMHSVEYREGPYAKHLADAGLVPPSAILFLDGKILRMSDAKKIPSVDAVKAWIEGKTLHDPLVRWDEETSTMVYEQGGEPRRLTRLAPDQASVVRYKSVPRFADVKYLVPRAEWREISRRKMFPADEWILDQDGIGSCVGNGAAVALRKTRYLSGMTDVKLSPAATYAQINGGRDNGAVIGDSMTALMQVGTCSYSLVGEKPFYLSQLPKGWKEEAKRFKIDEAYITPSFDEMMSAVQLGYVVVYGMQVGSNFERFTSEGVAGISPGPGNHCMHADGAHKLANGQWAFDNANSWGATWGPTKNGRCYLVEGHFARAQISDAYAIKTAILDPQDKNRPVFKAGTPTACKCSLSGTCACEDCKCGPIIVFPPPPASTPLPASFPTVNVPSTRIQAPAACYWNGHRWVCPLSP